MDRDLIKKLKEQSFSVLLSLGVAAFIYWDSRNDMDLMRADIKKLQQQVSDCYEKRISEAGSKTSLASLIKQKVNLEAVLERKRKTNKYK